MIRAEVEAILVPPDSYCRSWMITQAQAAALLTQIEAMDKMLGILLKGISDQHAAGLYVLELLNEPGTPSSEEISRRLRLADEQRLILFAAVKTAHAARLQGDRMNAQD